MISWLTFTTLTSGRLSRKAFRSMPFSTMRLSKMCPFDLKSITAFFYWVKRKTWTFFSVVDQNKSMWCETERYLEVREHVSMISNEEGVGHVGQFLRVLLCVLNGRRVLVTDDVVHEGSTTGAWVSEPHGLRGWKKRSYYSTKSLCIIWYTLPFKSLGQKDSFIYYF